MLTLTILCLNARNTKELPAHKQGSPWTALDTAFLGRGAGRSDVSHCLGQRAKSSDCTNRLACSKGLHALTTSSPVGNQQEAESTGPTGLQYDTVGYGYMATHPRQRWGGMLYWCHMAKGCLSFCVEPFHNDFRYCSYVIIHIFMHATGSP